MASPSNYVPTVLITGDSIVQSNGAVSNGGFRFSSWTLGQGSAPFWYVGPFSDGSFVDPLHCGISGITIANLLVQEETAFGTYVPDVVIRQAGINDIGVDGLTAPQVITRMTTELTQMNAALSKPWGRIVCLPLLRCTGASVSLEPTVVAVNALMPAMVAGLSFASRVTLLGEEWHGALLDVDYQSGGLHPNDAGDNKLGPVLWNSGLGSAVSYVKGARF